MFYQHAVSESYCLLARTLGSEKKVVLRVLHDHRFDTAKTHTGSRGGQAVAAIRCGRGARTRSAPRRS